MEFIFQMANKKTSTTSQPDLVQDLQLYAFALVVLTLVWLLTGTGYFWPVWFLIGWVTGPLASKYFKQLYAFSQNQWATVQKQVLDDGATSSKRKKAEKSKSPASDDSDIAGA